MPRKKSRFRVTVYYCEPLYARTRGIPVAEQSGTFTVDADDEEHAKQLAISAFKEAAARSSMTWPREITRVVPTRQADTR